MSPNGKVTHDVVSPIPPPLTASILRGEHAVRTARQRLLEASAGLGLLQLACWLGLLAGHTWAAVPLVIAALGCGFCLGVRYSLQDLGTLLQATQVWVTREDTRGRERA